MSNDEGGAIGCLFWVIAVVLLVGGIQCGDQVYGFGCAGCDPIRFTQPASPATGGGQ